MLTLSIEKSYFLIRWCKNWLAPQTERCLITGVTLDVTPGVGGRGWAVMTTGREKSSVRKVPPRWEIKFSQFLPILAVFQTAPPRVSLPLPCLSPGLFFGGIDPVASSQPLEVTYFLLAFGWRTRWPHRRSSPIGHCAPRNPFILLPPSSLRLCLSETWLTPLVISVIAGFPAISRLCLHQLILYKSRF